MFPAENQLILYPVYCDLASHPIVFPRRIDNMWVINILSRCIFQISITPQLLREMCHASVCYLPEDMGVSLYTQTQDWVDTAQVTFYPWNSVCIPNGTLFPVKCTTYSPIFWPEPYGPIWLWSKIVHYIRNRVPFGMQIVFRKQCYTMGWTPIVD